MNKIEYVDIVFGLCWGDEGKGKVVSSLCKNYDMVCRFNGGNNAGHTIYVNNNKYKTHLLPSGVFHGIKSVIGPNCVVNVKSFFEELKYIEDNGFKTDNVFISPKAHIITDNHINIDKEKNKYLGTTSKGIGPCYTDKVNRKGIRAEDIPELKKYLWDGVLEGKILCEGAQGFRLDIDYGNYPYVTSSSTLPYMACSLGFSPYNIRSSIGCCKIYDTRSGVDPDFPPELHNNNELKKIAEVGQEFGVTTGRGRIVNYLNLDKLIEAINITGCDNIIISKCDILEKVGIFKLFYKNKLLQYSNFDSMKKDIIYKLILDTLFIDDSKIIFSSTPHSIF
jgi:adenylosuccinate synthase